MKITDYIIISIIGYTLCLAVPYANAVEINVNPKISASEEYTDNVFLTENNTEDDFILSVSPGISAQLLGRTQGLEISFDPSYVTFHNNSRSDTWRHTANLQGWTEFSGSTRFEIRNAFFLTDDPLPDRDIAVRSEPDEIIAQNTTVRRGRRKYYSNSTRALLEYRFGEEDFANLSYEYSFLKNDDDQFFEDNKAHNVIGRMQYWIEPRWGARAQFRFTRGIYNRPNDFIGQASDNFDEWLGNLAAMHRFDWQWDGYLQYEHTYRLWENNVSDLNDDYMVYNPSVGLNYNFSDETIFSFNAGYFYREIIEDRGEKDNNNSGPTGLALMQHGFAEQANLLATLSGGYSSSDFSSQSLGFYKFFEVSSSVTYDFAPQITGEIFGSYFWAEYLDTVPERTDQFGRIGASLIINPMNWLSIRLQYSLREYWSDETAGYTENRIFLGLQLQPERPFRW